MMVQTICKLTTLSYLWNSLINNSKEFGNNKYYKETTELEKWQSEAPHTNPFSNENVFKKICVHTYRFRIVFAGPHYN